MNSLNPVTTNKSRIQTPFMGTDKNQKRPVSFSTELAMGTGVILGESLYNNMGFQHLIKYAEALPAGTLKSIGAKLLILAGLFLSGIVGGKIGSMFSTDENSKPTGNFVLKYGALGVLGAQLGRLITGGFNASAGNNYLKSLVAICGALTGLILTSRLFTERNNKQATQPASKPAETNTVQEFDQFLARTRTIQA